jgi:hypothetical protein
VLALGVDETAGAEKSPELEEDDEGLLDAPEAYGSFEIAGVVDPVVVVVFAAFASAGSSPACSRRASTPKTATKLAMAPAAKRRALGTRRRRGGVRCGGAAAGSSDMTSGSTPDLKSS